MSAVPPQLIDVERLSAAYHRVLLTRRLLRSAGLAMFSTVLFIVGLSPALLLIDAGTRHVVGGFFLLLAIALSLLTFVVVRAVSALSRGSQRAARRLLMMGGVVLLVWLATDVATLVGLFPQLHLQVVGLAALSIHVAIGVAFLGGLLVIARADASSRAVLTDANSGRGLPTDLARFFDLPGVTTLANRRLWLATLLVVLAGLLEGAGVYVYWKWGDRLLRAAERPELAVDTLATSAMLVPVAAVALVLLLAFSTWMVRLSLRAAGRVRRAARRIARLAAEETVALDKRAPVLFLRAFADEQVPFGRARVPRHLRVFDPGSLFDTLEEMIVHELAYIGPIVALADPANAELPLGAARWRVDDDEWQSFVDAQIHSADVVVLAMAATAGLRWEITALQRAGALSKTIFVFPPDTTRDAAIVAELASTLGVIEPGLREDLICEIRQRAVFAAALSLDGRVQLFVASGLTELGYLVALRSALAERSRTPPPDVPPRRQWLHGLRQQN
jgi:hypothetical protein